MALFPLFKNPTSINSSTSLDEGEQACDIYDAYLAYYPQSTVRFEELMLLKRSLAKGDLVELGLCRVCKGLIINNRIDGCRPTCAHCEFPSNPNETRNRSSRRQRISLEIDCWRLNTYRELNSTSSVQMFDSSRMNAWYGTKAIAKPTDNVSIVHTGKSWRPN